MILGLEIEIFDAFEVEATGVDWGSVPAWIATVGAMAAAAVFVVGRLDRLRAQAAEVFAVVTDFKWGSTESDRFTKAEVVNGSDRPVFDIQISALPWDWKRKPWSTDQPGKLDGCMLPAVRPNSTSKVQEFDGLGLPTVKLGDSVRPPMYLEFTDGAGRRWARSPDGRLRRIRRRKRK